MTEHSIVIFYIYIDIDTTNIDIVVRNSRNKITQLMHHYPETMLVGESKLYWLNKKDTLKAAITLRDIMKRCANNCCPVYADRLPTCSHISLEVEGTGRE